jgi:hypothetical protein
MNHSVPSIKSTGCHQAGSVLAIAVLSLAILSLIAAGTLAIVSSKYNSTFQASSWQESLEGAEAGVDIAMAALAANSWTGWKQVNSSTPPRSAPSGSFSAPIGPPTNGQYYFYEPQALAHVGEGNNTIKMFITVDTAGAGLLDKNQWYRIRATGSTDISGTPRASSERLDNNLRKLSLFKDRITGVALPNKGHAQRTIEMIAEPVFPPQFFANGLTTAGAIVLPGQGNPAILNSFDSSDLTKSTNGLYDPAKAQKHANMATLNATGSAFNDTTVFGNLTYSGAVPSGLKGFTGTIATPYKTVIPPVTDPTWTPGTYTPLSTVLPIIVAGTKDSPATQYKWTGNSGNLTLSSGQTITFKNPTPGTKDNYVILWVPGNISLPKNAIIVEAGVNLVIYGDKNITFDGGSFNNKNTAATIPSGTAAPASMLTIYGTAPMVNGTPSGTMYIGGDPTGGTMVGIIDAPGYKITIETNFSFSGAITGGTASIISNAGMHFDEKLTGAASPTSYAYASWFEDTR